MDVEKLTRVYLKIRDARTALKREFDEKDQDLKGKQALIDAQLLKFLQDSGVESVKTGSGTVYRQEEMKPSCSDWDAFYRWIGENDAYDFLEKRVTKRAVADYMEQHDGKIPPGLSIYREFLVRVRRTA